MEMDDGLDGVEKVNQWREVMVENHVKPMLALTGMRSFDSLGMRLAMTINGGYRKTANR